jgi:MFS family permease
MVGGVTATAVPASAFDAAYGRRVLATVLAGVIVFTSSMTIVSASLPTMAADLDSTEGFLSWAVTGLFLAMAVATPIMGRLGDSHGHRRMFLIGATILGIGTLGCAVAPSAPTFVAARMVVGLGISSTMPNGMALIMAAHPVERRGEAMGWFQMAMTGMPVIALVAGGPLIEAYGWRIIFAILFPLSIVGTFAAWRVIRPDTETVSVPVDWGGASTLAVATLGFLLWLEFGGRRGFGDAVPLTLIVIAAVGLSAFLRVERRVTSPMLRLDYFRSRNFTGPLICQPLSQFAYMGGFLIAPLLLAELFGYSVGTVALILLFRPAFYSALSPVGGRLAGRFGERTFLLIGAVLMVASMASWVAGAHWTNLPMVILSLILSGVAMGLASPSYSTAVAAAVDVADLGVANGMSSTLMNIGMLSGIQSMFTVLGDGRGPDDFARVFAFGGVVAAVGIAGALMMRRPARQA